MAEVLPLRDGLSASYSDDQKQLPSTADSGSDTYGPTASSSDVDALYAGKSSAASSRSLPPQTATDFTQRPKLGRMNGNVHGAPIGPRYAGNAVDQRLGRAPKPRAAAADDSDEDPFRPNQMAGRNSGQSTAKPGNESRENEYNAGTGASRGNKTLEQLSDHDDSVEDEDRPSRREPPQSNECQSPLQRALLIVLVAITYVIYVCVHVAELAGETTGFHYTYRAIDIVVFHLLFLMFLINYILAVVTDPGTIPRTNAWVHGSGRTIEFKADGEKRYCKWCEVFKPDRTHHCRQCGKCVLKMDHHCPWLGNCIGFYNHKYFLNLIIFGLLSLAYAIGSMLPRIIHEVYNVPDFALNAQYSWRFIMLCGGGLYIGSFTLVVALFLTFQMYLLLNGMTTIEFCEHRRNAQIISWSRGCCGNMTAVFGPNPMCWLCPSPCGQPKGDGTRFKGQFHHEEAAPIVSGRVVRSRV